MAGASRLSTTTVSGVPGRVPHPPVGTPWHSQPRSAGIGYQAVGSARHPTQLASLLCPWLESGGIRFALPAVSKRECRASDLGRYRRIAWHSQAAFSPRLLRVRQPSEPGGATGTRIREEVGRGCTNHGTAPLRRVAELIDDLRRVRQVADVFGVPSAAQSVRAVAQRAPSTRRRRSPRPRGPVARGVRARAGSPSPLAGCHGRNG